MLILKMNADLPISVRNLGHSIGMSVKRLETSLKSDVDLNNYPRLKSVSSEHLYNMQNIGRTVLDLGDSETFDFERLFARLKNLQTDYSSSAQSLLDSLVETLFESDREAFNLIVPMAINEVDRIFENEIQLSSVNRLEELQSLKESTAISHISGMLRTDWSAKAFVEQYRSMFETKSKEIESNFREVFYQNSSFLKIEEIDVEIERELKLSDEIIINFCEETVIPEVSAYLRGQYSELFVPNEDLSQLQANAEKVVSNCMLRGAAKKLILSFNDHLREEVSVQVADFLKSAKKSSESRKFLGKIEEEIRKILDEEFENVNLVVTRDSDTIQINILPVSVVAERLEGHHKVLGDLIVTRMFMGESAIDVEADLKDNSVTIKKVESDFSEVEAQDAELGQDLLDIDVSEFDDTFKEVVYEWLEGVARNVSDNVKRLLSESE